MIYKNQSKSLILIALASLFSGGVFGQLTVDLNMTPQQMVQNLVGTGVEISNVVVTACDSSYGYYYSTNTEMGTNQGLLLTTGKAEYAIGPNNKIGTCSSSGAPGFIHCDYFDNGCPGSPLLNAVHDRTTRDATMFEFDIIPKGDSLKFKYTFASEEYNEWVGSPFNDVFGFFISGPNVGTDVNLALIPNSTEMVAINTVNASNNSGYWYNNSSPYGQFIQYDAFTIGLEAKIGDLIPCETYHLKLVIADGTDYVYDSGVFINAIESNPVVVVTATSNGLDYMVEGCNPGTITFSREFASPTPLDVTYWVGGTATNGVDYTPQLGSGDSEDPIIITIPADEQSVSIELTAADDGIAEGTEYITIYLVNPLCDNVEILDSVLFYIHDHLDVAIVPEDPTTCAGQCIELTGTSSLGSLAEFEWSAGVSDPSSLVVEVCPTENTTYTLTASLGDCVASAEVEVAVSSIEITLDGEDIHCDGGATGWITSTVSGGVEPYIYSWSGPNGFTSSEANPEDLEKGQYCLTVTDAEGCETQACITLEENNELNAFATMSSFVCYPISCFGSCDGAITLTVDGGVEPYTYSWSGPNGYSSNDQNISGLCAGTYYLEITDAAGCVFTNEFTLEQPAQLEIEITGTVDLLCTGVETGQASVASTGGCSPFIYSWSHDASVTGPNATNLASGTYYVSVTDQNGCVNDGVVTIVINDPIDPVTAIVDGVSIYPGGFGVSCPGATDGWINITPQSGTAPYSVEWYNASNNTLFSSAEDLADAPCGEYEMIVTDGNECAYSQSFYISCVPAITVTYVTVPNPCGAPEGGMGEIDITVSGGHDAPFTYSWTGPDGFTSTDEDLTGLNSGDYVLTVSDSEDCFTQITVHIGENDQFSASGIATGLSCYGSCDGAIDITVTPAGDYNYSWTGPNGFTSNDEDIDNLCAGNYILTISTDDCEDTYSFEITQPTEITIAATATDPLCYGMSNGSIDVEIFGGSGDYTYNWLPNSSCTPPFAGSSNQNLGDLFACDYTLEVTDNVSGCTATTTVSLEAVQVMEIVVETTNFAGGYNISCHGENDGQISVFVTGGTPDCGVFDPYCYQYDWVSATCATVNPADYGNSANSNVLTGLPAGTYGVLVTDVNGCLATTCVPMVEPDPITSNAIIDDIDCGETYGSITPNLEGGSNSYTSYQWTSGNIGSNAANATTLINLEAGNYTLVVTDSFGCSETFNYTINETPTAVITVSNQSDVTCFGGNDGSFTVEFSGGVAPYEVSINGVDYSGLNDGDVLVLDNLVADVYSISLSDVNECEVNNSVTITEPSELQLNLSAVIQEEGQIYHLQCNGDENGIIASSVSGGVGSYTYEWTDSDMNILAASDTLFNLAAGNYCLKVTDGNGCFVEDCFEITEPDTPLNAEATLSLYNGVYNISCFGAHDGSIDVTVTGGVGDYSYDWDGTGTIDGQEDQSELGAGEYAVVIVDDNFCQFPLLIELVQPDAISFDVQVSLFDGGYNVPCTGDCSGTIDLTVSGGNAPYEVSWTGPNGFTSDDSNLTGLCPGTYTVTVTDANDCEKTQDVVISEPQPLSVTIDNNYNCTTSVSQLCASGTGGSGGYSYVWSTGANGPCITVTASGNYTVTITDSNGCEKEIAYVVAITEPLSVLGTITNSSCGLCNGEVNTVIAASPGYTFTWNNGATTEDLSELCPGSYAITVTDINNCSTVHTFTVAESPAIGVNVTSADVLCYAESNGWAAITVTGATEPIEIVWYDGNENILSTETLVDGLVAGTYQVSWSDAAGCGDSEDVIITEPDALEVQIETSIYGDFNISTVHGSDGAITIEVAGGTPQYTYEWSNDPDATKPYQTGLSEGDYIFTVTDANGCKLDTIITLVGPEEVRLFNGLTPNGDGINDTYVIPGVLYCAQAKLTVFNRWGNIVYEKANYQNDWYGQTTDGKVLSDGTYFVIFEGCDNKKLSTYVDLRRE